MFGVVMNACSLKIIIKQFSKTFYKYLILYAYSLLLPI